MLEAAALLDEPFSVAFLIDLGFSADALEPLFDNFLPSGTRGQPREAEEKRREPSELARRLGLRPFLDLLQRDTNDTLITSEWRIPNRLENGLDPEHLLSSGYGHQLAGWIRCRLGFLDLRHFHLTKVRIRTIACSKSTISYH
jgi:hypothetical protein